MGLAASQDDNASRTSKSAGVYNALLIESDEDGDMMADVDDDR